MIPYSANGVTALILAGGKGVRIQSVVSDRQKVMADVHGRPFITFILDRLAASGFKKVIFCTGHLGAEMEKALGCHYNGLELQFSRESKPLGTGGAVRNALPMIDTDPVLVMNGDSYHEVDLPSFIHHHQDNNSAFTMALTHVPDVSRYGQVALGGNSRLINFQEKETGESQGWINAGIYLINPVLIETIPEGQAMSLEKDIFPNWLTQPCYGYKGSGRFLDIGTPDSYHQAESLITH